MRIVILSFALCCLSSVLFAAERPNIVVVMVDDMGFVVVPDVATFRENDVPQIDNLFVFESILYAIHDPRSEFFAVDRSTVYRLWRVGKSSLCTSTRSSRESCSISVEIRSTAWSLVTIGMIEDPFCWRYESKH
jgi:hypothetical protein